MCENYKKHKGDEIMAMIKEKKLKQEKEIVSRKELRTKLIQETINENREALKRLSRT